MNRLLSIIIFICSFFHAVAQDDGGGKDEDIDAIQQQVDSILSLITPAIPDSTKARLYNEIGLVSDNTDTVLKYSFIALEYCKDTDLEIIADAYADIGWAYYIQSKSREALDYNFRSLRLYQQLNMPGRVANKYIAVGQCYHELNITDSIFYYFDKALQLYTDAKDTAMIVYTYQSIGKVNSNLGFHTTAMDYYSRALYLDDVSNNYQSMGKDYQNIGYTELELKNYPKAIYYLRQSEQIYDTIPTDHEYLINNKYFTFSYLSESYLKYAIATGNKMYADSCNYYLSKIGNFFLNNGHYDSHVTKTMRYSQYLVFLGKYKEALEALEECYQYLENDVRYAEYYERMSSIYEQIGDYKNAMEAYKKMHDYKTKFANDSTLAAVANFQTVQAVKSQEVEKERLRTIIISLAIGLGLTALLVVYIIMALKYRYRTNKELATKNHILDIQKNEIEHQKLVITQQWHEVETVNKNLINSIDYALRIQTAAISPKSEIDQLFPEHFIYYKPRDVVSGDYYRVAKCGKYHVMITADCTGHGIPGAFLSMLGISALKEFCVAEEDAANPGLILDRMRDFIKSTLISDSENNIIDDGMDMTICCYDFENMELRYAAANQLAILVRNGELIKLKGDKMPVGRYIVEKKHFQSSSIPIQKGDMVYTFSDGIQDQLGGDLENIIGQKFYLKNLEKFLADIYSKPLDTQRQLLDQTITDWRCGRAQVDDMTLIGVRV